MRISIIGTAGRKEDGPKMSAELYHKMYNSADKIIRNKFGFDKNSEANHSNDDLILISGGAAWSDNIAINLYYNYKICHLFKSVSLHLHLPAKFLINENRYEPSKCGQMANYYHRQFSKKMKYDTMENISEAIKFGAVIKIHNGFYARNFEVGKTELLIAFTWGPGEVPKDGGTKHTWDNSTAKNKIHIPLQDLK